MERITLIESPVTRRRKGAREQTGITWVRQFYKRPMSELGMAVATLLFDANGGPLFSLQAIERIDWRHELAIEVPYHRRVSTSFLIKLLRQCLTHQMLVTILPRSNTSVTLRFVRRECAHDDA